MKPTLFKVSRCLLCILFFAFPVMAFANDGQDSRAQESLSPCSYEQFNITFLCDPKWPVHEEDGIAVYTIAVSPGVSLSITRVSDELKYLEQVNKEDLALTDQYADGFVLQDVMLKDKKAKMVMGFSKADPDVRYLDYYLLNNGTLYSVLFAVGPKEEWDSYKFLIKTIAESIDFN